MVLSLTEIACAVDNFEPLTQKQCHKRLREFILHKINLPLALTSLQFKFDFIRPEQQSAVYYYFYCFYQRSLTFSHATLLFIYRSQQPEKCQSVCHAFILSIHQTRPHKHTVVDLHFLHYFDISAIFLAFSHCWQNKSHTRRKCRNILLTCH